MDAESARLGIRGLLYHSCHSHFGVTWHIGRLEPECVVPGKWGDQDFIFRSTNSRNVGKSTFLFFDGFGRAAEPLASKDDIRSVIKLPLGLQ